MPKQKQKSRTRAPVRASLAKKSRASLKKKRSLKKRFLLHPVSVMVILCAGVLIVGYTISSLADSITVSAEIAAPALSEGAKIINPLDGASLGDTPILVSGSCPSQSYIKLFDNSLFIGSAWCLPSNTFSITAALYTGQNDLLAQDYNVTDQPGPQTPTVVVYYNPPAPSLPVTPIKSSTGSSQQQSQSTPATTQTSTTPLALTSGYHYQTFVAQDVFTWQLDVEGGVPPYNITVNWGDGTSTSMVFNSDPVFTITNIYKTTGYYPIIVQSVDKTGSKRSVQLAALIKQPGSNTIFNPIVGSTGCSVASGGTPSDCSNVSSIQSSGKSNWFSNFMHNFKGWLWLAWSSYIVVLLMLLSFWLGEKEEYYYLLRRPLKYAHKKR